MAHAHDKLRDLGAHHGEHGHPEHGHAGHVHPTPEGQPDDVDLEAALRETGMPEWVIAKADFADHHQDGALRDAYRDGHAEGTRRRTMRKPTE